MSIHNDYGYDEPDIAPFYSGLLIRDRVIYAKTGSVYKGKEITAENDLPATIDMLLFSLNIAGETLDPATEVKPLVDLVFTNIAYQSGVSGAYRQNSVMKSLQEYLHDGLQTLEDAKFLPIHTKKQIVDILDEHYSLWPKEILPLYRVFKELSQGVAAQLEKSSQYPKH